MAPWKAAFPSDACQALVHNTQPLNPDPMKAQHPLPKDHPVEEEPRVIPHDPRDEPMPATKPGEKGRSAEEAEEEARREEGVDMQRKERDLPRELSEEKAIVNPTQAEELPTGTQSGQTTRGAYSTDASTGAGRYADHRAGKFGTEDVAQPGNDQRIEPDPIDPAL